MIKNILSSFGAKLVVLFATLGIVLLNTRYLGQEGQGLVSLINLGILIIVSVSNIMGGGALVYLLPRIGSKAVVGPVLLWILLSSAAGFPILWFFGFLDTSLLVHVCLLAFLQSLFFFLHQVILSKEKILIYNYLISLQLISLLICLLIFYVGLREADISRFIISLYISFGLTVFVSLASSNQWLNEGESKVWRRTFSEVFPLGVYTQGGNILHLFNLRFALILLEKMSTLFAVGIFSLVLYAAEAIWNIGKSLSIVLGSRLSNSDDPTYRRRLTLSMLKVSFVFTFPLALVAALIPDSLFRYIFGRDIDSLHLCLMITAPFMLLHACTMIISHYFSGTGNHRYNMWGSAIGLVAGISSGWLLVEQMDLEGAAISFSLALLGNFVYHLFIFGKKEKVRWSDFVLRKSDFENLR